MLFSCKYAALALPIRAFTSASDPPCSSMMLPRYFVGTCSSSQILMERMWGILAVTATSAFSVSAGMLSGPASLPLLTILMAMLISSIVGGATSIGSATSVLGGFTGSNRFKSSLKCSTHLFRCPSMLVNTLPCLFFTSHSGLR
ncbi:unnamed protein product [Schistosoma curassoni]|uniref:Secreted protein n=1 Tax=Schistosoma curassoni TaxID=6186 RepID=A0A183L7Y4_9TREM|nr:unnamed protein product [Schistosoma curassoni]